ncbi:MAG TPA: SAM-dependent methyltransferase [Jiangellaceae bacterium]|nr:SAM-dependent methyltransferase [Jiangellaceae bacterium]
MELLDGSAEGATAYLVADLRQPDVIFAEAASTLDLAEPVAVLMFTILHNIRDSEDPWAIVARYVDAVCSGSYVAISHLTADFNSEVMAQVAESLDRDMAEPFVLRGSDDIARFFDGTELLAPGLVHINDWRPDDAIPPVAGIPAPIYGAVGRKP